MKTFTLLRWLIGQPSTLGLLSLQVWVLPLSHLATIDGNSQSVFNDAWASSAQVITIPSKAMTEWTVPSSSIQDLQKSLALCNGHKLTMQIQFKRDAPAVCMESDSNRRAPRFPKAYLRRSSRRNIVKRWFKYWTRVADFDWSNCTLSVLFQMSFPRLFYLSASDAILFVDESESQFNTLEVDHVGIIWIDWIACCG